MIINLGKELPKGAIPCQEEADPITGHFPHWLLCKENNKQFDDRWYLDALKEKEEWEDGTYELVGPHFSGNPYNYNKDILIKHGSHILEGVPYTYVGIKQYLHDNMMEGIVFYNEDGKMCKVKRSDFNFKWNVKGYIQTHTNKNNLIIDKGKNYVKDILSKYSYPYNIGDSYVKQLETNNEYNCFKILNEYIEELEHRCGVDSYVFIKDDSVFNK